jgi:hypothetical protein
MSTVILGWDTKLFTACNLYRCRGNHLMLETPINKATASELGKRGNKIRWEAWRANKIAEEAKESAGEPASEPKEGIAEGEFRETAKNRAREHMSKLQDKIDEVLDKRDLDVKAMRDLADAVLKLEQVEQRLSGRPLPGTLKPTNKPVKRVTQSFEPAPEIEPSAAIQIGKPEGQDFTI